MNNNSFQYVHYLRCTIRQICTESRFHFNNNRSLSRTAVFIPLILIHGVEYPIRPFSYRNILSESFHIWIFQNKALAATLLLETKVKTYFFPFVTRTLGLFNLQQFEAELYWVDAYRVALMSMQTMCTIALDFSLKHWFNKRWR